MRPDVDLSHRWHFPEPEVAALPNGLAVWSFDLPGQHVAAFDLVLPVALTHERPEVEGVAEVALAAADEGTTTHPDGRITELLELQGAALHGTTAHDHARIGGDAPARRLSAVMPLFAEVVADPEYAAADVAHHVSLQVAAHDSREASPGAVAKRAWREAVFGADIREGRPTGGVPETLTHITADDVRDWHDRFWAPTGATLVLAGHLHGIDLPAVLAELDARWRPAAGPAPAPAPAPRPPRVVIADMPDAVQATVQAGCLTPGRRDPDWAALKLAGHALTGAFASRLNVELRERRGLTYGVHGGFSSRRTDGQFTIGASFRTEMAAEALAVIREQVALAAPFTAAEIADATRFLVGIAPLANETASDIVRQAAVLAAAGERAGYVNEHFAALEAADAEQATLAFRRHVSPQGLTIAVSGPAAVLEPALTALGFAPEVVTRRVP